VAVAGVAMYLHLVSGRGGSLLAEHYTRDLGKALAIAGRLESAGLRPNVVRSGPNYVVYIATADLLRLAERDGEIRWAIALYLADKVKNGTPRQREIAEKLLKRNPLFSIFLIASPPSRHRSASAGVEPKRRAWSICGTADDSQHQPASSRADDSQKSPVEAPAGIRTRDLPLSRGVATRLARGRPHTGAPPLGAPTGLSYRGPC
jgi:hypothetical protein